jgi:hypothetical protein
VKKDNKDQPIADGETARAADNVGGRQRFVRWMSGSGEKPITAADSQDSTLGSGCDFVSAALADYAELEVKAAENQMPEIAAHMQTCPSCRQELECLREMLAARNDWANLASEIGGAEPFRFIVAIANAWHWFVGGQDPPVRLRREDYSLGRRMGDWILLPQPAEMVSLSRGQGRLGSLLMELGLMQSGVRLCTTITPEHLSSSHRQMWRLLFEIGAGSSVERIQLDLTNENNQSLGMRTLRPHKGVEYQVDPPTGGFYFVTLVWIDAAGHEKEHTLPLPLRAWEMNKYD